jgi:hypothetical protein
MEKLTVDADGKIIIPPEVIQKRGLHPGDELTLVESAEGLLVYQGGVDDKTLAWWNRDGTALPRAIPEEGCLATYCFISRAIIC